MSTSSSPVDDQDIICRFLATVNKPGPRSSLSFLKPFMAVNESIFRFADHPEDNDSAYQFAWLCNNVPDQTGDWHTTGRVLWNIYSYWLLNFVPAPEKLTPQDEARLKKAREYCQVNYERYAQYYELYYLAELEVNYLENMPSAEWPDNYASLLAKARIALDKADMDFEIKGDRSVFDEQYEIMVSLGKRDMGFSKVELFKQFGEPSFSNFGDYYPTYYTPAGCYEDPSLWRTYTVYGEENATRVPLTLTSASNGADTHKSLLEIPGAKITFDFISLNVMRNWFLPDGMEARSWKWASSTAANPGGNYLLSDGASSPKGHLIMYATQMLLVRDIRIEWPSALTPLVSTVLNGLHDQEILRFGPLTLGTKYAGEWSQIENVLVSDQTNIAAYHCRLLPQAPHPDWNLWPPLHNV